MSSAPVQLERRDGVAVLTIARPERRNALSREVLLEFGRIGRELAEDSELRAVILTGTGEKAFCAGADLKERQGMTEDQVRSQLFLYQTELTWLARSEVPVIAAINGAALGGGLELALLCDLRVAAEHAVFGLPETSLGIIPASGGTQRLPRAIGEARAKEMILFCRRIDASEALRIGLINRVSPAQKSVVEDALEWMAPILHGAPIALKNALAAIDAAFELSLDQGLELERVFYEECLRSEDRQEALRAFAEKRSPKFTGR